ncbi:hypothetical protein [Chengkuizengella sediminis]|uniref:hypothetical protein n=1 Tax=Chengkuizengella sediminis TaxID=1885917 RepID=UPI00138994B2|nr:hypothetical protein [Chengkuizengella sediminis]NDI35634.1 hypothetical protein [Chengkuizengella sediminis]
MGLNKEPLVVVQMFVLDPYGFIDPDVIRLPDDGTSQVILTVDVCVKEPQETQVLLESMIQIAVDDFEFNTLTTFEVIYELLRNGDVIATINDEIDYSKPDDFFRHTNLPNFSLVDNNPSLGINTYELVCTNVIGGASIAIFAGSRSLKATVFTL